MKRSRLIIGGAVSIVLVFAICCFVFSRSIRVSYHSWRMNADFNTIYGDPQPAGNGIASFDVSGIDVDAKLKAYEYHRYRLVELGVLAHVTATFPFLASDGSATILDARKAFVYRMWDVFPSFRHYFLAPDGSFAAWVPIEDEQRWRDFLESEMTSQ